MFFITRLTDPLLLTRTPEGLYAFDNAGRLMMEKVFARFSLFLNFENFLDTRQTRFDTIFTGPVTNPTFRDIYAPVDGLVVNGGIKLKL